MKASGSSKTCSSCREVRDVGEFHRNRHRPDGLHTECKSCVRARNAAWRKANPEKKRAQREKARGESGYNRKFLLGRYGLTPERYDAILASQGGKCAICGVAACSSGKRFAVDHDHACCPREGSCGKCIRGLLCINCNHGLGNFRDNKDFLTRAIEYLSE